jgi:hypothetical protein
MRTSLSAAFLLVGFLAAGAPAADLTKIDRTIAKEPAYQGKPKYCLLVFGPEAKFRVWLVLDGDTLYVDRNGNGNLTEAGNRVGKSRHPRLHDVLFEPVVLTGVDGKRRHLLTVRTYNSGGMGVNDDRGVAFGRLETKVRYQMVGGLENQCASYLRLREDRDKVEFADRPTNAPIIHFDGPLTLALCDSKVFWNSTDNEESSRLRKTGVGWLAVVIGTPGIGKGTFAVTWTKCPEVLADIEFPNKDPGGKPIAVRVTLLPTT